MENTCKCCGSTLEPQVMMIPHYNGGFVPESVEYEVVGYYPCQGCDLDEELEQILARMRAQEMLENPENFLAQEEDDDLPW